MQNRLGATTTSYQWFTLDEALAGIAAAGFHYVELAAIRGVIQHVPLEASPARLRAVRRQINDAGLVPLSLSGHSDLTAPAGQDDACRALDLCAELGIGLLNTAVGGAFNDHEDEAAFLAGIPALAEYAARRQVVIGLEIHGTLTGTGRQTRTLIEKVDHPAVRINYDTANSEYFAGLPVLEDIEPTLPYLAHCHLKDKIGGKGDWNFPALGEGHIDFAALLSVLERAGYTGPFSVEVEFQAEAQPSLGEVNAAMAQSRRYLASLGLT